MKFYRLFIGTSSGMLLRVSSTLFAFGANWLLTQMLTVAQYGAYAFALAWANIFALLSLTGLNKLIVRETAAVCSQGDWPRYRALVFFVRNTTLLLSLAFGGLGLLLSFSVLIAPEGELRSAFRAGLLLIPLLVISQLWFSELVGLKKPILSQFVEMGIRPLLFVLVLGVLFTEARYQLDANGAVYLNCLVVAVSVVIIGWGLRSKRPKEYFHAKRTRVKHDWLKRALPLGLLAALQLLNTKLDLVMLGVLTEASVIGQYNIAVLGSSVAAFVLWAVMTVIWPELAEANENGDRKKFQKVVDRSTILLMVGTLPIAAALILAGRPILGMFGDAYSAAYSPLIILVIGHVFTALFGVVGAVLTMTRNEGAAAQGAGIALVANIILNWLLIPEYGMQGAAVATVSTQVIWNLYCAYWMVKKLKVYPSLLPAAMRPAS